MEIDEFKTRRFDKAIGFEICESHEGKFGRYEAYYSVLEFPDDPKADVIYVLSLVRKRGAK